ncbi:hypothetical protein GJV03_17730 [Acinetobacter sp. RIT698]|uniref:RHS repeat domain-containing protein n=1 Tax=Acinetobacter sp. RIT698 TaxID=2666192 RepID=UPI0012AC6E59|nr:RHS repeat-associated core domain-containing protein [Acinetobacter sp. RIT698]MRT39001.1 hypothetical protein [Acinetobacter sp. RIT698]
MNIFRMSALTCLSLLVTFLIYYLSVSQVYARPFLDDLTASPDRINSCISDSGINPISKQVELSKVDIKGPLPFIRSYSTLIQLTPKEYNQAYQSPMDRDLKEMGIGWTHNYAYKLEEGVAIPFYGVIPALRLFLPEEGRFITFLINRNQFIRSSGAPYWGTVTDGETKLIPGSKRGEVIAQHKGTEIVFQYQSNNKSYIATKATYPNGKVISFGYTYASEYKRWLLITVSDNLGNALQINHHNGNYNRDLKGVISSVKSNNTINPQVVNYNYEIRSVTWPKPFFMFSGVPDNVYSFNSLPNLISVESTANPREDYTYQDYYKKALYRSQVKLPILSEYKQSNIAIRNWAYSDTSILSQIPGLSNDVKIESNDNILSIYRQFNSNLNKTDRYINNINLTNNDVGNVPATLYGADERFSRIQAEGAANCLTYNNRPIKSFITANGIRQISSIIDQNQNRTDFKYDANARLIGMTEAKGTSLERLSALTYETKYWIPNTLKRGNLTQINVINELGQIIRTTQNSIQSGSLDKVTHYEYLANGLLISMNGPRNGDTDKIKFTYDNFGNLGSITKNINGIDRITSFTNYNSFGFPQQVSYPSGIIDNFVYNNDGTVANKTTVSGGATDSTTYQYDGFKRLTSETDSNGEIRSFGYNLNNQLIKMILPDGSQINRSYFSNGLIASENISDNAGNTATENSITLDRNGYPLVIQQGNIVGRNKITNSYDANGNLIQTTTALGVAEKWKYDALGRVNSHTDGLGNIYTFNYDVNDNLIQAKDPLNSGTQPFNYRNGGVLIQEVNSDYGNKNYGYDESDLLTQFTFGRRKCDYLSIDAAERVGQLTCSNTSSSVESNLIHNFGYTYDQSRFNNLDSIISKDNAYGVNDFYVYDALGRMIGKSQTNKSVATWGAQSPILSVGYGYTPNDKPQVLRLASGRIVTFNYDQNKKNQLKSISLDNTVIVNNVSYNNAGLLTVWNWGGGAASYGISYDATKNGTIKSITNHDNAGAINFSLLYESDQDGRISKITRNNGTYDKFSYDAANRLISESRHNGGVNIFGIQYTYDRNGNRLSLTATGAHQQPQANVNYTYAGNKLSSINGNATWHSENAELIYGAFTPTYDNAGNRRKDKMNGDASASQFYMTYNDKNQRTLRAHVVNGSEWKADTIQYVYDEGGHLIGEYNSNGKPLVEYIWFKNKPVVAIYGESADIYWIVTDLNNTPRRLINSKDGSTIVWSWDSTAFGVGAPEIETVKFHLRFPGQIYDELTKQFYNHNRYYNPELGRYMEPDPAGLEFNPNPYAYANNNPIMYVDPTGKNPVLIAMGVGAGISGAFYTGKIFVSAYRDNNENNQGVWSNFSNKFSWTELGQQAAIGAAFGGVGKAAFLAADVHVAKAVLPESATLVQKASNFGTNLATNKTREFSTTAGFVITGNLFAGKMSTNLIFGSYNDQRANERMNQQIAQQQVYQQLYRQFYQQSIQPPRNLGQLPTIRLNLNDTNAGVRQQIQNGLNQNTYW